MAAETGKEKGKGAKKEVVDLEEKKTIEDAIFTTMYALVKNKTADPWQITTAKIVLEGLIGFLMIFDPTMGVWEPNNSFWLWKIVMWVSPRYPIMLNYTYTVYVVVMYVLFSVVILTLLGALGLAWRLRTNENSKGLKILAKVLQVASDIFFIVFFMVVADYFTSFWSCGYTTSPIMHNYWTEVECFGTTHLINACVALIGLLISVPMAVAIQTATCDLNPVAKGVMASSDARNKIKVVICKATFISVYNILSFVEKPQFVVVNILVFMVFWFNFTKLPFLRDHVNYIWCGMWLGILYTACLGTAIVFNLGDYAFARQMTLNVLYGIFPAIILGYGLTWVYHLWMKRPLQRFTDPANAELPLKKVYKFTSDDHAIVLARVMRKFDLDGIIDPEAADLGEMIIKCGLTRFPNSPQLLILLGNFQMEVRRDGPASRTCLTTVMKSQPGLVDRYQVFCTVEDNKRLKEESDHSMDMQAHIDFQKQYRRALLAHKDTLSCTRELWKLLLKKELKAERIDEAIATLDYSTARSQRIYKKLLERFPHSGLLMKRYGRFLEDVKNDFKNAGRAYAECAKLGGTTNGIQTLSFDFASQVGVPEMLVGMDVNEDAVCIINMAGTIMMVSPAITELFGYEKKELEGQNVSILMPPPFNARHNGYLQHYQDGGKSQLLDSMRELVALHKSRHVFPIQICVTKISGVGADAIFLGVMRSIPFSKSDIRCWVSTNGIILCCGPMFSSITGVAVDEMVGVNMRTVVTDPKGLDDLLQRASNMTGAEMEASDLSCDVQIVNKYTGTIECTLHVQMGGTEHTRLYVLHIRRKVQVDENLLVCDEKGNISFATIDLARCLGYTLAEMMALKLDALIPQPVRAMHQSFLLDAPPQPSITSCRNGVVVNLVAQNKSLFPARLSITQREEPSGLKHVVKITSVTPEDYLNERRISIVVCYDGTVRGVAPENSSIFGFSSSVLKGLHITDLIDVFSEWKERTGSTDMQLLLLALLDHEDDMPGSGWRAKIKPPQANQATGQVSNVVATKKEPRSVILQAGLHDFRRDTQFNIQDDGTPHIRLTLWKREMLVGTMELDPSQMRVHKLDQNCSLIMGRSMGQLLKQPLHKILDVPHHMTWAELMGGKRKQAVPGKISPIRIVTGMHPDGGHMRLLMQGTVVVDPATGKSRVEVNIKPDLTFAAAKSDIWAALGLDGLDHDEADNSSLSSGGSSNSSKGLATANLGALSKLKQQAGETDGADLLRRWVKNADPDAPPEARASRKSIQFHESVPEDGDERRQRLSMDESGRVGKGQQAAWMKLAASMPEDALSAAPSGHHHGHHGAEGGEGGEKAGSDDDASSDGSSQQSGGHSAFSSALTANMDHEILVDSRRGKVLRKLGVLLGQAKLAKPVEALKVQTIAALAVLLTVRLLFFIVLEFTIHEETGHADIVFSTASACDRSQVITVKTAVMAYCRGLPPAAWDSNDICSTVKDVHAVRETLEANAKSMEEHYRGVYLGMHQAAPLIDSATRGAWETADLEFIVHLDTNPPIEMAQAHSLFEQSMRFTANTRELLWKLLNLPIAALKASRSYYFIMNNGHSAMFDGFRKALDAMMVFSFDRLTKVKTDVIVLFIFEALIITPACIAWMWWLVSRAESIRLIHFGLMASVPMPSLTLMATRPVKISEESDDESGQESDEEGEVEDRKKEAEKMLAAAGAAPAQAGEQVAASGASQQLLAGQQPSALVPAPGASAPPSVAGTEPHHHHHHHHYRPVKSALHYYLVFLIPLGLWLAALIGVYAYSFVAVEQLTEPLAALNMAMHVTYRFSHMRISAFQLVSQTDAAKRDYWREQLKDCIANLTSEYDALLYGGVSTTQVDDVFQHPAPAAAFMLPSFSHLFFKSTECMRKDKSTCYPVTSEWHEATHHGLDSMMQRILAEMTLLTKDADEDLVYNNSRYDAMFHVGVADLYEGLQQTAEDFVAYSHQKFSLISLLQIILLICLSGLVVLYYYLLTRPYLKVHNEEKKKVAGLLSHVPNEVDINSHTRKMLRHATNPRKAHAHHDQDPSVQRSQQSSSSWGIASSQG